MGEVAVEAGDRRRAHEVVVQRVNAVDDDHGAESGNKRRHVQVGNDDPVNQADDRPDGAHQQDHQRDRHGRHIREYLIGIIHRLQHGGGNHRRQTHLTAGGEVGPLRDDKSGHAEGNNNTHRGLGQNITQVEQT